MRGVAGVTGPFYIKSMPICGKFGAVSTAFWGAAKPAIRNFEFLGLFKVCYGLCVDIVLMTVPPYFELFEKAKKKCCGLMTQMLWPVASGLLH